jgi:hypothetical protein
MNFPVSESRLTYLLSESFCVKAPPVLRALPFADFDDFDLEATDDFDFAALAVTFLGIFFLSHFFDFPAN